MAILYARKKWRRSPTRSRPRAHHRAGALTTEEHARIRAAVRFMGVRYGSLAKLAKSLGMHRKSCSRAAADGSTPTLGMALEIARLAGVTTEDVLTGRFPGTGVCPVCGRGE